MGRRQPPYILFTSLRRPVFLVNSRVALFTATHLGFGGAAPTPSVGTPSPEVTGPICLVPCRAITHAPVDILLAYLCRFAVRSPSALATEAFPGRMDSAAFPLTGSFSPLGVDEGAGLPTPSTYRVESGHPSPDRPILRRPPRLLAHGRWRRNIHLLPFGYAFRPRLRHRLTLCRLTSQRKP